MSLFVQKYGGSSLSTSRNIKRVADRITEFHRRGHHLIVVVSAMGDTTTNLMQLARSISPQPNRRELDMLLSTGETISMTLLSMALHDRGTPSISFTGSQAGIMTDRSHTNARIIEVKPIRVKTELDKRNIVILAGFQGVCPETKDVTTLGRGGSDTTAVAMASHFKAKCCEFLKDVDGVFSADPKVVPDALHLPRVGFDQLVEMTHWGARVLNFEAAHAAREHQVNVFVGAAHGPSRGTKVVRDAADNTFTINRIAAVRWVRVNGTLEADTRAWWRRLFEAGQWAAPRILYVHNGDSGFYLLVKEEVPATVITEVGGGRLQVEDPAYSAVTVTFAKPVAAEMSRFSRKLRSEKIAVHSAIATALSWTFLVPSEAMKDATLAIHSLVERITL